MDAIQVTSDTHPLTKTNFLGRHPLLSFFTLAFLISWLLAMPSLFLGLPYSPFQAVGAYGPLFAAVIVSAGMGGGELKMLLRRMTNFHFGIGWYLLAIFGYVPLFLLAVSLTGVPLAQALAGRWTMLFVLYLPALLTSILFMPIGEETGWTGFALPHLQGKFSPWLSAVILGAAWAAWFLPGYFIPGVVSPFHPEGFLLFVLQCISTRILWTWVTNNARGSGIAAVLLSASTNALTLALLPGLQPALSSGQIVLFFSYLRALSILLAVLVLLFTRGRLSYKA